MCMYTHTHTHTHTHTGVGGSQLIFTGTADLAVHVAYKSAADLFLDTALYNAHSTAADVLYAGVPMVTLAGTRMAVNLFLFLLLFLLIFILFLFYFYFYFDLSAICGGLYGHISRDAHVA